MRGEGIIGTIIAWLVIFAIACACWLYPNWNVWSSGKAGEAELSQAEYNTKVKVQEAQATEESAKSLAAAEVIRAGGVAQANKIIGDSLKGNEAYLHYLWLHGLEDTKDQIIYVPTEANLPIMEANRLQATGAK